MIGAILKIIVGLILWLVVPNWITYGPLKVRQWLQLICNIIGVLVVLSGGVSLVKVLF